MDILVTCSELNQINKKRVLKEHATPEYPLQFAATPWIGKQPATVCPSQKREPCTSNLHNITGLQKLPVANVCEDRVDVTTLLLCFLLPFWS